MNKIIYAILLGGGMYLLGQAATEHTVKIEVSIVREQERCKSLGGRFDAYKFPGTERIVMSCWSDSKELINY